MAELAEEELVHKKLSIFKLDTLLMRETRLVSQLGRIAIDKYVEALQLLAPEGWDQPITVPVAEVAAVSSYNGRRIVLKLDHPAELIKERERALAITKRMTGLDEVPRFTSKLDITLGKLGPVLDNFSLQQRLEDVTPPSVTLLPTVIEATSPRPS